MVNSKTFIRNWCQVATIGLIKHASHNSLIGILFQLGSSFKLWSFSLLAWFHNFLSRQGRAHERFVSACFGLEWFKSCSMYSERAEMYLNNWFTLDQLVSLEAEGLVRGGMLTSIPFTVSKRGWPEETHNREQPADLWPQLSLSQIKVQISF